MLKYLEELDICEEEYRKSLDGTEDALFYKVLNIANELVNLMEDDESFKNQIKEDILRHKKEYMESRLGDKESFMALIKISRELITHNQTLKEN